MKKLLLASVCSFSAIHAMANTSTEQRIEMLEAQLQQLKQELQQQKQTQQQLQQQQHSTQTHQDELAQQQKKQQGLLDNVDVYGVLRFDGAIDFKSTPSARGRTINQINKAPFEEPDSIRTDFTAAATRFGIHIRDLAGDPNIKARLEGDFWTNGGRGDGSFRVRHAYIQAYDWTLGQASSLMANGEIATDAVDYSLLLGNSIVRHPQVQYAWKINPANTWQTALEYFGGGDRSSELPALTTKYTYKHDATHLLAQGFINQKQAQGPQQDIEEIGWGVGLGGRYRFNEHSSIQAQYYHMLGDQRLLSFIFQGATSDGILWGGDFSVDHDKNELLLNRLDSLTLGYTHVFSPKWRSSIAASVVKFDDGTDYAKANPETNEQLTDYVINGIYSPSKHVDIGAEYHHGKRETFDGKQADVSRINMTAKYSF